VAGGTDGGGKLADSFWEYDPAADAWTQKAPVPQYGERGMAFAMGSKGYFGLNYSRRIYEYDPVQNTWRRKADFPSSAYYGTRSFVLNGKAYVVGGIVNNGGSRELWEFTP
jgi:N-acetylneuraminic acid mutarotase